MGREPGAGRGGGRGHGEKVRHRQERNSQLLLEADVEADSSITSRGSPPGCLHRVAGAEP